MTNENLKAVELHDADKLGNYIVYIPKEVIKEHDLCFFIALMGEEDKFPLEEGFYPAVACNQFGSSSFNHWEVFGESSVRVNDPRVKGIPQSGLMEIINNS